MRNTVARIRVPNVCGVVITTNYKEEFAYLPPDDRRHYVAWSEAQREDFEPDYWNGLYTWLAREGNGHVAAFLRQRDLSGFDPKAPPSKTAAFWAIVDANRAPEEAELADALDKLGNPCAVTLAQVADAGVGIPLTRQISNSGGRFRPG